MKRLCIVILALATIFGFSIQTHATLTTIGTAIYDSDGSGLTPNASYNVIYDSDSPFGSIVYLDYTTRFNGTWQEQGIWAIGLNGAGVLTYSFNPGINVTWAGDWRLPISDTCFFYNCTGSEMGHLYYTELMNTAGGPLSNLTFIDGLTSDLQSFENLYPNTYWSATEFVPPPPSPPFKMAMHFDFGYGYQHADVQDQYFYALAVRPGDVSAIPEPTTILLYGLGFAGAGVYRRMRKKK